MEQPTHAHLAIYHSAAVIGCSSMNGITAGGLVMAAIAAAITFLTHKLLAWLWTKPWRAK